MGIETGINWSQSTVNFWVGCSRISEACRNCYMFRDQKRYGQDPRKLRRTKPGTYGLPLARHGARSTKGITGAYKLPDYGLVFVNSLSDFFHVNVGKDADGTDVDDWRADAWAIIRQRPDLTFQILTKRADRIADNLPADWGDGYPNVWLGVTAENAAQWEARVTLLKQVPAAVRFVSYEPACGPLADDVDMSGIHWLIIGGESGNRNAAPQSRTFPLKWAQGALASAQAQGVPTWMKQVGSRPVAAMADLPGGITRAGMTLDGDVIFHTKHKAGADWDEWPPAYDGLKVRQFPDPSRRLPILGVDAPE